MNLTAVAAGLRDLSMEAELLALGAGSVIGMDEVGRGCIAGPVGVGAVRFDLAELLAGDVPPGIHDSKQLRAAMRQEIDRTVRAWQPHHAVGAASVEEIDALGMSAALCLAGRRALAQLPAVDWVLLDGSYDWLSRPLTLDCLDIFGTAADIAVPRVRTVVKGDSTRVTIAAASVIAKVERDALMTRLATEHPEYLWDRNAGYATAAHRAALAEHGITRHHRRSFRLLQD